MATAVTDENFATEVLAEPGVVMVDFWAPWCGPCRVVGPIVDELAVEYSGRAKVVKLNVDDNPQTSSRYGIQGIPTLLFFKGGQQVDQLVGARPKQAISAVLDRLIG